MNEYLWPQSRLGEALEALTGHRIPARFQPLEGDALADWIEAAARSVGFEAQPVETSYADFEQQLPKMAPALLLINDGFLVLLQNSTALTPDRRKIRVAPSAVRTELCSDIEVPAAKQIDDLLERAQVPASKRAKAREAILRERFSASRIRGIWILRLPPSADFRQQLKQARVPQRLITLGLAHAVQYVLWIIAWGVVGRNVFSGRTGLDWLPLWSLLLLTLVPLRVTITWMQGLIAIGAGALLKQRLFFGAMRLTPDRIRHQGAGQLLGRVLESEAVEALALSGGFLGIVALIELLAAAVVLSLGAGGILQAGLLMAWIAAGAFVAKRYLDRNRHWTTVRLAMTHDLVENMVGHRTRLAQLPPDRWHLEEDESLHKYLDASKSMDNSTAVLLGLIPRGWLVLGLIGLIPAFAAGARSPGKVAIAVGGMLLAYRALKRLTAGAWQVAGAAVAWQRVSELYHAAERTELPGSLNLPASADSPAIIDARELSFRYEDRSEPVLRNCRLQVRSSDHLILEGPSGGGKSTLVSLLVGLREPASGQILADGFDRQTLGAQAWRKRIAAAPQFHENHVLAETFAFNLFMGRRGVPGPKELEEAELLCRELGLGDVLDRMPAGVLQMVGETGWQLSHGERSRLYIARTLIQDPEVIVLDESFAALDPENLQRAIECVLKRARSLLVVAHR